MRNSGYPGMGPPVKRKRYMKRKRDRQEKIISILKEHEAGRRTWAGPGQVSENTGIPPEFAAFRALTD